jgi:Tfp pilus assembly protein PilN
MIRVNLADNAKKRTPAGGAKAAAPKRSLNLNLLPIVHLLIILGAAAGGYVWYLNLSGQVEALDANIRAEEDRRKTLEAVIKQDGIYDARKKTLEVRLKIVRNLRANQVSPVVSLDKIADAVSKTNQLNGNPYVWLNRLEQSNATFNMSGNSTTVLGIADFIANLEGTGYFKNIVQFNAQDSAGNYNFTLSCEYAPPRQTAAVKLAGAN